MKPIEECLSHLISKHDLPAVKAQLKLFECPQDFFVNINDFPSLAAVNEQNESFFLLALACGNVEMIRYLFMQVSLPERVLDLVTNSDETLLGKAAEKGLTDIVEILLNQGASKNKAGLRTPMAIAAQHGHVQTMQLLLTAEANIDLPENNGNYPLHNACIYNQIESALFLLESSAHCTFLNNKGESALHAAIKNNNPQMVFLLLTYGAGVAFQFPTDKQALALYVKVNALIIEYPNPIILLSSGASKLFPQAITTYQQFRAISFKSFAQRQSLKIICQLVLKDQSIASDILDQVYILLRQITLPSLKELAAQYIKLNINTVLEQTAKKTLKIRLPNDVVVPYSLQNYVAEQETRGFILPTPSQPRGELPVQIVFPQIRTSTRTEVAP